MGPLEGKREVIIYDHDYILIYDYVTMIRHYDGMISTTSIISAVALNTCVVRR